MNKIILVFLTIIFCINTTHSQTNLNDYKYVIVPNNYSFFKEADKYQLNSLTKFLFNKYGFMALMADETYPDDLKLDNCLALRANVIKIPSILKTKMQVELRDCGNALVFESTMGETKVKEFNKAYNLALRDAFISIENIDYKYSGKTSAALSSNESKPEEAENAVKEDNSEVKKLKAKIKALESEKNVVIEKPPINVELEKGEALILTQVNNNVQIETSKPNVQSKENILYAQKTESGFQVVDSAPKIVMILHHTGQSNTFIVKGKDAIVYKEDGFWYLSANDGNKTKTEVLNLKF